MLAYFGYGMGLRSIDLQNNRGEEELHIAIESSKPLEETRLHAALKSALSLLVKEGRFTVVDSIDLGEAKTKKLAGVLVALQTPKKTLVVDDKGNENLRLSIRNIQQSQFLPPEGSSRIGKGRVFPNSSQLKSIF